MLWGRLRKEHHQASERRRRAETAEAEAADEKGLPWGIGRQAERWGRTTMMVVDSIQVS